MIVRGGGGGERGEREGRERERERERERDFNCHYYMYSGMPMMPRISRTMLTSMKIPKTPCSESSRKKSMT